MMALLKISWKNVKLHWRHSLASLLSIMAAVISLNVFQGYMLDLENLYYTSYKHRNMYGDLIVVHRLAETAEAKAEPWKFAINKEMQTALSEFVEKNPDLVNLSAKFLNLQGLASNGSTSAIFTALAYDDVEASKLRKPVWEWNTLYGEPAYLHEGGRGTLRLARSLGRTLGCVPATTERALIRGGGYKAENRPFECQNRSIQLSATTDSGQLNAFDTEVSGLVDAGFQDVDRRYLALDLKDAQTLLNTDRITYFSLLLHRPLLQAEATRRFEEQVVSKFPDLKIMPWQAHPRIGDMFVRTMSLLSIFRNFVVIVIIAISVLSVFNSMTKAMSERTREIGTLMSLGFLRQHIRVLFLGESIMLGCIGVAFGLIASVILTILINAGGIFYKAGMLSEPVPFQVALSPLMAFVSGSGLILLTGFTTAFALRRVLSKRIIECLQHV